MPKFSAGIHLEKAAGQNYTIHIPHRHAQGETVPLIMALHWGGPRYRYIGKDILEQFGLPAFAEMQAVIVAPDRKRRHWAHLNTGGDLANLIEHLDTHYNLHPTQRAVVGFSMGGQGVWYLGEERPDLFTCGVAVASPVPEHILEDEWYFPIFAVHSELDELFSFANTARNIEILQNKGAPLQLHSLDYPAHRDIREYISTTALAIPWMEEIWAI
jgi:predicted peptidase